MSSKSEQAPRSPDSTVPIKMIATAEQVRALADELKSEKVLAFDTEFIRESTFYPIVELIQIATKTRSWLVDVQPFKKSFAPGPRGGFDPGLQPLLDLFADSSILKIVHAAQGDQECLFTSFGMVATPAVDTAVLASLCGYGDNIGLGRLAKAVLNIDLEKGHARTNWSVRPLPEPMMRYALADVDHLVELGERLLKEVEEKGRRDWAFSLSAKLADTKGFDAQPEDIALKLAKGGHLDAKAFGALVELVVWREKRVRELNIPRRWLADDSVLLDLARVRPKSAEHLGSFRGLSKGEVRSQGPQIIEAISRGVTQPRLSPPERKRAVIPTNEENHVLDLIKCYLGILAERHHVASRHLATSAQLMPLLREKIETPADLVHHRILTEEAAELIGNELLSFIRGKTALRVLGQGVDLVSLE